MTRARPGLATDSYRGLRVMLVAVFVADLVSNFFLLLALVDQLGIADCVPDNLLDFADRNVLPRRRRLRHPNLG